MALALRKTPDAPKGDVAQDMNVGIENVGFSPRIINALRKSGIYTVGDLSKVRRSDILLLKNIGITCATQIDDVLRRFGIWYKY